MNRTLKVALWMGGMLILLASSGCRSVGPGSERIWIDVPVQGLTLPLAPVNIEGHTAGSDIRQVEIWVNESKVSAVPVQPGDDSLGYFTFAWQPAADGDYTISVIPVDSKNASGSADTVHITIGAAPPLTEPSATSTSTITPTPPPGITPTPTPTPTASITPTPQVGVEFWADPAELAAGACTTIHWRAQNVAGVTFGGVDQPHEGSSEDCLCKTQKYSLTVNYNDGTSEKKQITIPVTGECVTPTPEDDGPPPAPDQQVPADGATIGCRANQTMNWLPVEITTASPLTGWRYKKAVTVPVGRPRRAVR